MNIKLACGSELVPVDVPDNWINGRCYRPHPMQPCADAHAELLGVVGGLPEPYRLESLTAGHDRCVVAIDCESPGLFPELLPAMLEMIEDASSIPASNITIVISNRTLHPLRESDVDLLVDQETRKRHRVVLHNPADESNLVSVGETANHIPILVNRVYQESPLKIVLGGVRPDLLMGFTGGRAVICPGLAGTQTLRALYDFNLVADKNTRYGNFRDNPFHLNAVEATNLAGCDLAVNVVLNPQGQVHRITAGHFGKSHFEAMNIQRDAMTVRVKEPMDIVVTSGGGRPYDSTLEQLVSTLCAVEPVLKPEGTIVITAGLDGGLGSPELQKLIRGSGNANEALQRLATIKNFHPGQWVAQRLFTILRDHEVILYNRTVEEDDLWRMGFTPAKDINEAVLGAMETHGQRCKIVALPDGPLGIGEIGR